MSTGAIGGQAHEALFQAATGFFAGEEVRLVRYPGRIAFGERIVSMGNVDSTQQVAAFPRARDETVQIDMVFTAHAGGDPDEADAIARDAAFDMLDRFADHIRKNATELGDTVEWCCLSSYRTESLPAEKVGGITWEITATFESFYRIRG